MVGNFVLLSCFVLKALPEADDGRGPCTATFLHVSVLGVTNARSWTSHRSIWILEPGRSDVADPPTCGSDSLRRGRCWVLRPYFRMRGQSELLQRLRAPQDRPNRAQGGTGGGLGNSAADLPFWARWIRGQVSGHFWTWQLTHNEHALG